MPRKPEEGEKTHKVIQQIKQLAASLPRAQRISVGKAISRATPAELRDLALNAARARWGARRIAA